MLTRSGQRLIRRTELMNQTALKFMGANYSEHLNKYQQI